MDPAGPSGLQPVSRFDWERLIRRVRMHKTTKYVALGMATYADADGSRVRPGVDELALVLCISEPTVKRGYSVLRELGLIQKTKQGNRHAKEADTYRLTAPKNLTGLPILGPDDHAKGA
ncbi:hypothetical protein [Nocardia wallacei]|uniref:hypothetical protein n=2 Tax=Nocardia TaxID=1817 RepID=UPI00245741C4|nr:hypothetical protein [Nocardia wallacei]